MGAGKGHWIGKLETLKECFGNWHFEALCTCPFDSQRSIASIYSLLIIMIITINHHHLELTRLCRNMVVVEQKIFLHPWVLDDGARFRRFKTRRPRDYVVRRWGRGEWSLYAARDFNVKFPSFRASWPGRKKNHPRMGIFEGNLVLREKEGIKKGKFSSVRKAKLWGNWRPCDPCDWEVDTPEDLSNHVKLVGLPRGNSNFVIIKLLKASLICNSNFCASSKLEFKWKNQVWGWPPVNFSTFVPTFFRPR